MRLRETFSESSFVSFEYLCNVGTDREVLAQFRLPRGEKTVDAKGNFASFYCVKMSDMPKRYRKLIRQGIVPDETEKAMRIAVLREGMSLKW